MLYLSYCLSEDQSWLLAAATDDRGEIFETATINIDIPNRKRRKRASARRIGLQKLMDFILSVMSQGVSKKCAIKLNDYLLIQNERIIFGYFNIIEYEKLREIPIYLYIRKISYCDTVITHLKSTC